MTNGNTYQIIMNHGSISLLFLSDLLTQVEKETMQARPPYSSLLGLLSAQRECGPHYRFTGKMPTRNCYFMIEDTGMKTLALSDTPQKPRLERCGNTTDKKHSGEGSPPLGESEEVAQAEGGVKKLGTSIPVSRAVF